MRGIRPDTPNVVDWLALYKDLLWIAHTRRDRLRAARAIAMLCWLGRRQSCAVTFGALGGRHRAWLSDASELEVLRNVFVEEEYRAAAADPVRTIVDLGSHVGLSVLWFHALHPAADIVAVEPHPDTFRRLQRNAGHLDHVRLVNAAVAGTAGRRTLFAAGESWAASLRAQPGLRPAAEVECRTLDDLVAEHGIDAIDVLKLDIEGAEAEVLSTFAGLGRVRTLVCEYHRDLNDLDAFAFLRMLDGFQPEVARGDSARHLTLVAQRR